MMLGRDCEYVFRTCGGYPVSSGPLPSFGTWEVMCMRLNGRLATKNFVLWDLIGKVILYWLSDARISRTSMIPLNA